jgi:hypothetical protein
MGDRPLKLRKKKDGKLYLDDPLGWPPRHGFSVTWILELLVGGYATVTSNPNDKKALFIVKLDLANAQAIYKIVKIEGKDLWHGELIQSG